MFIRSSFIDLDYIFKNTKNARSDKISFEENIEL